MAKERKVRVTKKQIIAIREANKTKPNKRKTSPGPWTDMDTDLEVKVKLRLTKGIMGDTIGTYPRAVTDWTEKGWYRIILNVTSKSIKRDVEKHGLDKYLAACEKSLNSPENTKKYGKIVLLISTCNHSLHEDRSHRFISCEAKTNKKSIKGFLALRNKKYGIIQ